MNTLKFKKVNWPAIFCAVAAAFLIFLSLSYRSSWWQLSIGDSLGRIELSPLDVNIEMMGKKLVIPILGYLNMGSKFTLLLVAASLVFYSVNTGTEYSEKLLDVVYRKPLYYVIGMVLLGIVLKILVIQVLPFNISNIPIIGTSISVISYGDTTLKVPITASLTWVFWLAVLTAGLAFAAKIYHIRYIM